LFTGEVRGADRTLVRDARLHITWPTGSAGDGQQSLDATTDRSGRFRACGVPVGVAVRVEIRAATGTVDETLTLPVGVPISDVAITLRRATPPR